jgi:hypothetical protein
VGFIIQQRYYGDSLQDYVRLFKFAQKFFPHLKLSDIVLGKVSNTGSFDGHAVISFGIKSSWELTNKFHKRFKKYTGFLDFRY